MWVNKKNINSLILKKQPIESQSVKCESLYALKAVLRTLGAAAMKNQPVSNYPYGLPVPVCLLTHESCNRRIYVVIPPSLSGRHV